jgi:LacI family transcriptional regulator
MDKLQGIKCGRDGVRIWERLIVSSDLSTTSRGGRATRVSAADVARACGLTPATVSYVFNDRPGVSNDTRDKVRRMAADLGYFVDRTGPELDADRTRVLGVVLADLANPFYADIAAGAIDAARSEGYELFLAQTQESQDTLIGVVKAMVARRVDGLILTALHPEDGEVVRTLRRNRVPFVQVGRRIPQHRADFVGVDDAAMADEIFCHVVGHGVTDLAIVTGPRNSTSSATRALAFVGAAERLGIALPSRRRFNTYLTAEGGDRVAQRLLLDKRLPEAVIAGSDAVASGVIGTLRAAKVRVPEDVLVTGIDGVFPAASMLGELTTVDVPRRRMSEVGVDQLIRRINGAGGPPREVILAHGLRIGTTCGCVPPQVGNPTRRSRSRSTTFTTSGRQ